MLVNVDDGVRLVPIGLQAFENNGFAIIIAGNQRHLIEVASDTVLRWPQNLIVNSVAARALAARCKALKDGFRGGIEVQSDRFRHAHLGQKLIKKVGLTDRARISIEDEAMGELGLVELS